MQTGTFSRDKNVVVLRILQEGKWQPPPIIYRMGYTTEKQPLELEQHKSRYFLSAANSDNTYAVNLGKTT